jgi:hypothetical protein
MSHCRSTAIRLPKFDAQNQQKYSLDMNHVELRTLRAYAKKKGLKQPTLLGEAVLLVAAIGGYLGRKNDPPPGHQLLWMGYTAFQHMSAEYALIEDG